MPKSFLVRRKCSKDSLAKDEISLKKRKGQENSSQTGCFKDITVHIPVITHHASSFPRKHFMDNNDRASPTVSCDSLYEIDSVKSQNEAHGIEQSSYQRYLRTAWDTMMIPYCRSLESKSYSNYSYPPHSPSNSMDYPSSPGSCASTDVTKDELDAASSQWKQKKVLQYSQVMLCQTEEEMFWARSECPSPVYPYQPIIKKERKLLKSADEAKHTCKDCGKFFMRASSLSNHKLIHRNIKAFQCKECNMSFLRKSDLGKHTVTHTGVKPYQCDICYKSFSQSSNMLTHRRRHTGARPFCCNHCGKAFYRKVDVRRHSRIHQ